MCVRVNSELLQLLVLLLLSLFMSSSSSSPPLLSQRLSDVARKTQILPLPFLLPFPLPFPFLSPEIHSNDRDKLSFFRCFTPLSQLFLPPPMDMPLPLQLSCTPARAPFPAPPTPFYSLLLLSTPSSSSPTFPLPTGYPSLTPTAFRFPLPSLPPPPESLLRKPRNFGGISLGGERERAAAVDVNESVGSCVLCLLHFFRSYSR